MSVKKDIIYPIFLECCQYAEDNFWKNIFDDLAIGKTPYGTYINKDFLCCGYKDKEFSYKIEKKHSRKIYNDIYKLLKNKLGILSSKEKLKKRLSFHETEDRIKQSRKTWKDIRKKNIKDLLVERYVIDMKKKYTLSLKQTKYLLSVIFIGIVFKVFLTKDIHYKDGKIIHIDGIQFTHKNIMLEREIYDVDVQSSNEAVKNNQKKMSENWEKYLENLRKLK